MKTKIEEPILFTIHGPMISSSSDATEEGRRYKLMTGQKGQRWVVALQDCAAENIYADGGPGSQGMAGRTLTFDLEDGTTVDFIGPWKASAANLFADTGYDVRGQLYSQGIVALKRENAKKYYAPDKYFDVIHYDPEPVLKNPVDHRKMAQEYANTHGVNVFFAYKTKGGGSAGCQTPCEHEFGDWKRTSYKDVYEETCKKCGHVEEFEKDFS